MHTNLSLIPKPIICEFHLTLTISTLLKIKQMTLKKEMLNDIAQIIAQNYSI